MLIDPFRFASPTALPPNFETTHEEISGFSTNRYIGAVLLNDNKVFCVPSTAVGYKIIDIKTKTVTAQTSSPSVTGGTGGVLLPDGRVVVIPFGTTNLFVVDLAANSAKAVAVGAGTAAGKAGYSGGVVMNDGRVFCVPSTNTRAMIYDPATNAVTHPPGTYTVPAQNGSHFSAVLMKDGRVFVSPFGDLHPRIYDPIANTTVNAGAAPLPYQMHGAAMLDDGRIYMAPRQDSLGGGVIYDPATDAFDTGTTNPNFLRLAFQGAVTLSDGKVFCVPWPGKGGSIFNPATMELKPAAQILAANAVLAGGVLLPDGRVICMPSPNAPGAVIFGASLPSDLPTSRTHSPTYNKL